MFKLPKVFDIASVEGKVIEYLNSRTKDMVELDILFWVYFLSSWMELEANEICTIGIDELRKEAWEVDAKMYGVKIGGKGIKRSEKEEREMKIRRKNKSEENKIKSEINFEIRVRQKVDNVDLKSLVGWGLKVERNKFTTRVMEDYLDKKVKEEDVEMGDIEWDYVIILKWLVGRITYRDVMETLPEEGVIKGIGWVRKIINNE